MKLYKQTITMQYNTMQHKFGIYYKCGIKALNTFALGNGA